MRAATLRVLLVLWAADGMAATDDDWVQLPGQAAFTTVLKYDDSASTVTVCMARDTQSARPVPMAAGTECRPCARSNSASGSAYSTSKPPIHVSTTSTSAGMSHHGVLHVPVTAR